MARAGVAGARELSRVAIFVTLSDLAIAVGIAITGGPRSPALALIAVPTAIAGIYGMNFKNMPELQWEYGYVTVMSVIVVACAALFWRFRRVGWL